MADLIVVLKATSSFAQKAAGISPSLNSNNYGKGGGGGRIVFPPSFLNWRALFSTCVTKPTIFCEKARRLVLQPKWLLRCPVRSSCVYQSTRE